MEDLDLEASSIAHEAAQLAALSAIGVDWDGEVVRQSERFASYNAALDLIAGQGLTYECFCTRAEIRDAVHAPHSRASGGRMNGELTAEGAYPGTCRELTESARRRYRESGRPPAIRLRAGNEMVAISDDRFATVRGRVDDLVLRRNDGVPAYNLAVVVDDAAQGITEVVRGDDLLSSTPRQVLLQRLLGLPTPSYLHVPLVLGADRVRLAKRHGAVTLEQLAGIGCGPGRVLSLLAASLGLADDAEQISSVELLGRFDPNCLPQEPWILPTHLQRSVP